MVYGIVAVDNMKRMMRLLLTLLLVPAGSEGARGLGNGIYEYTRTAKTWTDAQTFCREEHTDLVTVNSAKENLNLTNRRGWMGLYREGSDWKWSRGGEEAIFFNWKDDHPVEGHDCAFKHAYVDVWESDQCERGHSYICYDERLVLVKKMSTWEEALRHCRALEAVNSSEPATFHQNHRYDLATLLSPGDMAYARRMAQGATTNEVWTGRRYLAGEWLWVGGEEVDGSSERERCASQRFCGVLVKDGDTVLETRECHEQRNFLCYKRI